MKIDNQRNKNTTIPQEDCCTCLVIHEETVDKVRKQLPPQEKLHNLAEIFKVFGDLTRIRILCALMENELCVCDIAALLQMSQSSISHQLRVLKQARLVKYRREGKVVYYSFEDEHVRNIFAQGLAHADE